MYRSMRTLLFVLLHQMCFLRLLAMLALLSFELTIFAMFVHLLPRDYSLTSLERTGNGFFRAFFVVTLEHRDGGRLLAIPTLHSQNVYYGLVSARSLYCLELSWIIWLSTLGAFENAAVRLFLPPVLHALPAYSIVAALATPVREGEDGQADRTDNSLESVLGLFVLEKDLFLAYFWNLSLLKHNYKNQSWTPTFALQL